jgi:hypothetical protein
VTTHHSLKLNDADKALINRYQKKYHLEGYGKFAAAIKHMLRTIAEQEGWIK